MKNATDPDDFFVSMLEIEEFLFSSTAAEFARRKSDVIATQRHLRESFRLHRFFVFAWLLSNGVAINPALLADSTHLPVGEQTPDRRKEGA